MVATEIISVENIPTIDLSFLRPKETSANDRANMIRRLGEACEDWGCFMVVNHGIPEDLQRQMLDLYSDFFDMKDEEKQRYNAKSFLDSVVYNASFDQTTNEVLYWRDNLRVTVHPTFHSPDQPPNFRMTCEEFARQTREIAKQLLGAICESLGLQQNRINSSLSLESCYQIMTANLYTPCPQPELAQGLPPHSDAGLLTIIMQNRSFPGLQVLHRGKWVPVEPIVPNSFCVLVSDLLQIFSNGKFKSVLHRCMVDKNSSRLSVLNVIGPPLEGVVVAPAQELVEAEGNPAAYRGTTYTDYIQIYKDNRLEKRSLAALRI